MSKNIFALFDIDGTLTESRKPITPEMKNYMMQLGKIIDISVVGGSDMAKQIEQLGNDVLQLYNL